MEQIKLLSEIESHSLSLSVLEASIEDSNIENKEELLEKSQKLRSNLGKYKSLVFSATGFKHKEPNISAKDLAGKNRIRQILGMTSLYEMIKRFFALIEANRNQEYSSISTRTAGKVDIGSKKVVKLAKESIALIEEIQSALES